MDRYNMGRQKMIYIQDDIAEKLNKEPNMSRLINELLKVHYSRNATWDELNRQLKILEIKKEATEKINEVKNDG